MGSKVEGAYYAVIPSDVRYDPDLRPNAKLLYGELTSLCNSTGYCWATNEYFAELYGLSVGTVSRLISQLEKKGYIRCEMAATPKGSERRIYAGIFVVKGGLDENGNTPLDENEQGGLDENGKQNNTSMNNKQDNTPYSPPAGDEQPKSKKTKEGYRPDWFEELWKRYPRKDNKPAARKKWNEIKPDRQTCDQICAALERDKTSEQWNKNEGKFIPLLSTWLHNRRWEDKGVDFSQLPGAAPATGLVTRWAEDPEVTS